MSSVCSDTDSFEVLNCQEFYPNFLDPIPEDVRRDLISIIHELNKDGAKSEDARLRCQNIIIKVEKELGIGNFVCEIVSKELSECLRKLELVTDAIDFMDSRLARLKTRDFGTLMILGSIYELSGEYEKALRQRNEAFQLAEVTGDPILICLSLVKQACDLWNLNKSDEGRSKVSSCLKKLEEAKVSPTVDHFPFTESVHRLIDLYKTLGYIHPFISDGSKSPEYYIKALHIVEQDKNAHVHIFKLETQIACRYSNSTGKAGFKDETVRYSMSAYTKIKELAENESFMLYHSQTIIHAMSRVAHALEQADRNNNDVLTIREESYRVAEKYLSQNHPDIARIAADIAYYLCCNISNPDKEADYIDKARNALENCDNDLRFLKLHVREISDAWKALGQLYSKRMNLVEAEKSFNEALAINKRVYGGAHPRGARIYKTLGHLYKTFNKFSEAEGCFTKCMEINDEFSPNDINLRKQIMKEISVCKSRQRKSYRR